MSKPIKVLNKDEVEICGEKRTRKWLENYVATNYCCVALRLMDEFEEPKPEVGGSAPPYCVEHNCQMILSVYNRPGSPPGNGWSCPECANERESKAAEKPTWELGTPCAERGCKPENHKFKVGDWCEVVLQSTHGPFKCEGTNADGDPYVGDNFYLKRLCCHVPAPKEAKPDAFQGPHWDANEISQASLDDKSWSAYRRDCDLRDEVLRMKEEL